MSFQNVWIIDDDLISHYSKCFMGFFAQSKITEFGHTSTLVRAFKETPAEDLPQLLIIDCYREGNINAGYSDYEEVVKTLKKDRPGFSPDYVIFMSGDAYRARDCRQQAIRLGPLSRDKIIIATRYEVSLANAILKEEICPAPKSDHSVLFKLYPFLNEHLDLRLPEKRREVENIFLERGWADFDYIRYLLDKKRIGPLRALDAIVNGRALDNFLLPRGPFVPEAARNKNRGVFLAFRRASGECCKGIAAFSIEEAEALGRQGEDVVLIVNRFDPAWFPLLPKLRLRGLVVMETGVPGHLEILAGSLNVSTLIVPKMAKDLARKHRFLQFSDPASALAKVDEENGNPQLSYVYGPIAERAMALARRRKEERPENVDVCPQNYWAAPVCISPGDVVAMDTRGRHAGLYKGDVELKSGLYDSSDVDQLLRIFRKAAQNTDLRGLRMKAVVDVSKNAREASWFVAGIGLVRTEHLAFTDAQAFQALRAIFEDPEDTAAFDVFRKRQWLQIRNIFYQIETDWPFIRCKSFYPVRVRLLDAPPDEFLPPEALERINGTIPVAEQRGAQIALRIPSLYEAQLDAIFGAYRTFLEKTKKRRSKIRLEVMAPMIVSPYELKAIMEMTSVAAKRHNFDRKDYDFGIMYERSAARPHLKELSGLVDFISVGTNDLKREMGIDPNTPLPENLIEAIIGDAETIRAANPSMKLDLCGVSAGHLETLKKLEPARFDAVVLPPPLEDRKGLEADWCLHAYARWRERNPAVKDALTAPCP